jgi:hypothetical protein
MEKRAMVKSPFRGMKCAGSLVFAWLEEERLRHRLEA